MTTWTNDPKLNNAPSITYDASAHTYDDSGLNYLGQVIPVWTTTNKST